MKLNVDKLTKSYGSNEVLKNINITFVSGKIYGVIGKNGVGKTTFFNCLSGRVKKDEGIITLIGNDNVARPLSSEHIGFVESSPVLPEFLTGREFIEIVLDIQEKKQKKSIEDWFQLVELEKDDQNKLIKTYSHGMKNKIQILSILICNSPVIFLDEPLTSLDVVVASEIKRIILKLKRDHIIIISTHILQLAKELCDEFLILNEKKLDFANCKSQDYNDFEKKIITILKGDENE